MWTFYVTLPDGKKAFPEEGAWATLPSIQNYLATSRQWRNARPTIKKLGFGHALRPNNAIR